jgi:hypothetical protein
MGEESEMKQEAPRAASTVTRSGKAKAYRTPPTRNLLLAVLMVVGFICLNIPVALAQGTAFTYQGRLQDGGTGASGNYDFQVTLWDSQNAGAQIGAAQTLPNVAVNGGVFTVLLDFGAPPFSGATRFLEIAVRTAGGGAFTTLAPRQPITSTPYAVRSLNASTADTVVVSGVPSGSGNYIQNTAAQQPGSNFNISGSGTAGGSLSGNIVNATTRYNLGGQPVLSASSALNSLSVGFGTGPTTAGSNNAFFGWAAGSQNVGGSFNSIFGISAGSQNTTGNRNAYFGFQAGQLNSTSSDNAFFGYNAGASNTASSNSFFGSDAGVVNTTGARNSFFGRQAGFTNATSNDNSFFGYLAGTNTTTGRNSFFGSRAGQANISGVDNSFFGALTGQAITGSGNSFFGYGAGTASTTALNNSFFGNSAGEANTVGDGNTIIGALADVGQNNLSNATAIGFRAMVTRSDSVVLGAINGVNEALGDTNVGIGTVSPTNRLHVRASFNAVATPANHVTLIENSSVGSSPDVLALKIGRTDNPDSANNFITFFNGNDASVGSIEGNGAGGVVLAGAGNDYAEWLPRVDPKESIQPGDVVGLFNGKISKSTNGASQVMVISTGAIVAGNDPGNNARSTHSLVAFIGQARARVNGTVQAGDFIVPSGLGDGVGIAVSPERISAEQFAQVIGQAWETSANSGLKQVRVAVGLIRHDPTVKRLLAQSRQQAAQIGLLQEKTAQIGLLQEKMAELEARLAASERAMQIIAASSSKRRSTKTAGSQNSTAPAYTLSVIRKAKLASTR